jgi:hypothetical protein
MVKKVKHIEVPKEWESTNDWDSHRELLWLALKNKGGDVVEMGSGNGSTLLLDSECNMSCRQFLSIEDTPEKGCSPIYGHYIIKDGYLGIEDRWNDIFDTFDVGILFIDVAPGELRKDLIEHWRDRAETIVVHDSEIGADYVYGMSGVLSTFKYRLDYAPKGKPHTTVVSNFIDVTQWV